MIELLYFASQIQCGAGGDFLNVKVDIYNQQELVQTISAVEDSVLVPVDSVNDLTFNYSVVNNTTGCSLSAPSQFVLGADDTVPNVAGFYEQNSIQTMLDGLKDYEELLLVELGTTNQNSAAFDIQDVVIKVNNNPVVINPTPTTPPTPVAVIYPD